MNSNLLVFCLCIIFSLCGCGDSTNATDTVSAQLEFLSVAETDSTIQYKPSATHMYRECDAGICADSQLFFVFFPGSDGDSSSFKNISNVIGKTGIRVLVLAYQNNGSLNAVCAAADSCYTNARRDRVKGAVSSSYVMSLSDGVSNRLLRALQTLGWTQFYSGSTINWNKIIVGGFSQGAGIAAWIGKHYSVSRVSQFSGTWDHIAGTTTPASWLTDMSATNPSLFYGFTHQDDSIANGVSYLDINWQALGMGAGSYQRYTTRMTGQKFYTNDSDTACIADTHVCSVADFAIPVNIDGSPKFSAAWKYICGR